MLSKIRSFNYIVKFTDSTIENIILNISIFLFGINFLYRSNYILMIAFILLVVFKRFKISTGNFKILGILIMFSISWFIFNDHELSAICMPIGYLIGCNIEEGQNNRINFVYLLFLSLALYTTSFFVNNIINNGISSYDVYNQLSIWTNKPLWATNIMLYSSLFMSLFGYVLFIENRISVKIVYFVIFTVNGIYALLLSRRAAFLMVIISFITVFVFRFIKSNKDEKKNLLKIASFVACIFMLCVVVFVILYSFNENFNLMIKKTDLYTRFIAYEDFAHVFNDMGRKKIRKKFINNMWSHLYGGSEIRKIIGNFAHDIWLDAYDAGGIISFVVIIAYTLLLIVDTTIIIINSSNNDNKALLLAILICILAQMSIEPIMEACKPYIYSVCIYHGVLSNFKKVKQ